MAADRDDDLRMQGQPDEVEPRLSPDTDEQLHSDTPTIEVDGEERVDPDANPDLINSAEADRVGAEDPESDPVVWPLPDRPE